MSRLDPARLAALVALLEERHVTRAAARLGVTQSTMSHRLRQLRDELGDPLLVRQGARHLLTSKAERLLPRLTEALASFERALSEEAPFDPRTSRMAVEVALPDLLAPWLPGLAAHLHERAPHLQLRVVGVPAQLPLDLAEGRLQLAVAPSHFAEATTRSRSLGELRFGVAGRRDHPALRRPLDTARWLAHPHVVVSVGNQAQNLVEQALARHGLQRRVGLVVPGFLAGLMAVAGSDLLMNAPLPLAAEVVSRLGIRVRPAPIELPPIKLSLLWHERTQADPAHTWLRGAIHDFVSRALPR